MNSEKVKSRLGFTLIELLMSMSIVFLMTPVILTSYLFISGLAYSGMQHNVNISNSRRFLQVFTHNINASQHKIVPSGGFANTLVFTQYDKMASVWKTASYQYDINNNCIKYTPDTSDMSNTKTILEDVYLEGESPAFSVSNRTVRCNVVVGEDDSVEMNISATTRNK